MNFDLNALRSFAKQIKTEEDAPVDGFVSKVVGVTFDNRQPIINVMDMRTEVRLVRERSNKFDFYAVGVEAKVGGKWLSVGYIPKHKNKEIAEKIDNTADLSAKILHFNEFLCDVVEEMSRGITIVIEGV